MTTQISQQQDWNLILRLINERYPILVRSGDSPVRERIQKANLVRLTDDTYRLELVTYRGRWINIQPVVGAKLSIINRDKQGVPVEYELELELQSQDRAAATTESLRFYA